MNKLSQIKIVILLTLTLISVSSWGASAFVVNNVALTKTSYAPGESVTFTTRIRRVYDGTGVFTIVAVLYKDGKVVDQKPYYSQTLVKPRTDAYEFKSTFVLPSTASGRYEYKIILSKADYSLYYQLDQITRAINVSAPVTSVAPKFTISNTALTKVTYPKGQTIKFPISIVSDQKSAIATIESTLVDIFGNIVSKRLITNQALSNVAKSMSIDYVLPTTMDVGVFRHKLRVLSENQKTAYVVTSNVAYVQFNVGMYNPTAAAVPLPATVIKLNPRTSANPLTGDKTKNGFVPNLAGYKLVESDEFDGTELNTAKWWTRLVEDNGYRTYLNDECQSYVEKNNHIVSNGTLKLVARPIAGSKCRSSTSSNFMAWESGLLRSKKIFKYGYFEIRVKMPKAIGIWPAFWLRADDPTIWPPEIDIFEYVINGTTDTPDILHTGAVSSATNAQNKSRQFKDPNYFVGTSYTLWKAPAGTTDFNSDYHIISGLWTSDNTYTTYLDGVPLYQIHYEWVGYVQSLKAKGDGGLAHVLVNLAMGGSWPTQDSNSKGFMITNMTKAVQQLEVDYVRVYQKTGDKIGTSTRGHDLCPKGGGC